MFHNPTADLVAFVKGLPNLAVAFLGHVLLLWAAVSAGALVTEWDGCGFKEVAAVTAVLYAVRFIFKNEHTTKILK